MPRYRDQDGFTDEEDPTPTAPADPDYPTQPGYQDPVFVGWAPDGTEVFEQQGQLIHGGSGNWQPWFGDRSTLTAENRAGTPPPSEAAPPPPPPGAPPPPAPGPSAPAPSQGPAPTFTPPTYTPPPPLVKPPDFSYSSFVAPDPSELQNDPQYLYTLKTEQDAIQRSAAARGILNTGGTIYDLLSNAKDIAATGYHDLWNRKMGEYGTNRANAFENYKTNYGIGKDVYDTNYLTQYSDPYKYAYQGAQDSYNSMIHNYDLNRQYGWYSQLFDFEKDKDAWDRKFKLLGLT